MYQKLALITLSALLLGGCTLGGVLKPEGAAKDERTATLSSAKPSPMASSDPELEAVPTTSQSDDNTSLETDLNNTTILNEDFSDLN